MEESITADSNPATTSSEAESAPAWFGPAVAAALEALFNKNVPSLDTTRAPALEASFASLSIHGMYNEDARKFNAHATRGEDALMGLQTASGVIPPGFPSTLEALLNLTANGGTELLNAYDILLKGPQSSFYRSAT